MAENVFEDQSSELSISEQGRVDILLDGLKNVFYNRLLVYLVVAEIAFVVLGYAFDAYSGEYSQASDAAHVMAGIFGVFGVLLAGLFALILLIGIFFAVVRTITADV